MIAMDAKRFLSLIDLHSRGLEDVLSLHLAGDDCAAAAAYAKILKARLSALDPGILPKTGSDYVPEGMDLLQAADAMTENRISLLQTRPHHIGDPIDWVLCPDGDRQWQSHLGYMHYPRVLLAAHAETGDTRYTEKWKDIHRQFLKNHPLGTPDLTYSRHVPVYENEYLPVYGGEGFCPEYIGGSWISLACASRVNAWLPSLGYMVKHDLIEDELLLDMTASLMTDHLHVLLNAPRRGTPNQFLSCAGSLVQLSVQFWEFFEAASAYFVGMSRLETAFRLCVLPDGTDLEQSPNYNSGLPREFREIEKNCALGNNRRMQALRAKAALRCDYLALITDPTGAMPDIAKAHAKDGALSLLEGFCSTYPEADALVQRTENLKTGKLPALPLYHDFPYGGISVMRGGWDERAAFLLTKYSRYSPGHKHEDANSIVLTALGRRMLVDSGNFNYANDPESRVINGYFYHSAAHNTLTVDALSQRRLSMETGFKVDERIPESTTNDAEYEKVRAIEALSEVPCPGYRYHSADFDAVQSFYADGYQKLAGEGEYSGEILPGIHRRTTVYIRRAGVFAVLDMFLPEDEAEHTAALQWNFGPDYRAEDFCFGQNCISTKTDGANLSLWCAGNRALTWTHGYGETAPRRGWYVLDYGMMVPAMDVSVSVKGAGKTAFLTLLYPHMGETDAVFEETASGVKLTLPAGVLTVEKSADGCGISFGGKTLVLTADGAEEA